MRSLRLQAFLVAAFSLCVTHSRAFSWSSIASSIESAATSVAGAAGAEATKIAGDLAGDWDKFKNEVESEIVGALKSDSDGVLGQFSIGHDVAPPISTRLVNSGVESNITIGLYCDECGYTQPAAFSFASQNFSGWDSSWLGFAVDSFDALFEVDIDLSANANGYLTLELWEKSIAQDGVEVEIAFQLHVVAAASASMSFTAGLNLSLLEPAAIMMPALDPVVKLNESQRIGFDQDNFSLKPIFNASIPKLDFGIQLSLRTVFSVTFEDINVGSLYLDLPAYNLTVSTLSKATSECQTPAAGTPSNQIYDELIKANGEYVAGLSYEFLGGTKKGVLDTWNLATAFDRCYAFFPGLGSIADVPPSSKSANLTAAAITTCTTGGVHTTTGTAAVGEALKSLSPGAKAGAVIGTLAGATIIAALAWFGGRASANNSKNDNRTRTAWAFPRPRSGKFFSRRTPSGGVEFSPITPDTPAWRTSSTGGYPQNPSQEMQPITTQSAWGVAKKEPYVNVNQAATPAMNYLPIRDDYGMPNNWVEEPVGAGYDANPHPMRNDWARTGQADGISLMAGEGQPGIQRQEVRRKEISRKSLPGSGMRDLNLQ